MAIVRNRHWGSESRGKVTSWRKLATVRLQLFHQCVSSKDSEELPGWRLGSKGEPARSADREMSVEGGLSK